MEQPKKILVVEDEMVIVMDLQSALEQFGYIVSDNITRGEDVIASIEKNKPDLILMDVKLEGALDGIETAQMVYDNYNIPVIFLTSFSNKKIIERAKKTNPFGYIVKPFIEGELFTNIEIAFYKHEAESKLKESEQKYRLLAENIHHIIFECNKEGVITYLNQPGMEMLGLTTSELEVGISIAKFISEKAFEQIRKRIHCGSDAESSLHNRDYLLVNNLGKRFYIEEYISPVYNFSEVIGFRGLCIDITSKKFKENLHNLYNKLTLAYNEAKADPFEIVSFLLSEFKNYFSYIENVSFNEYKAESNRIIKYTSYGKEEKEYSKGLTEHVIENKKPVYMRGPELLKFYSSRELPVSNPDNVCWAGFPVNFQNRPYGVFVFNSEVNQNALMASDFENLTIFFNNVNALLERISYINETLQLSGHYQDMLNQLSAGVIQTDINSKIVFISDSLCRIIGCSKREVIGKELTTFYALNSHDKGLKKKITVNASKNIPSQYSLLLNSCDGTPKRFLINSAPLKNTAGDIMGKLETLLQINENQLCETRVANN